MNNELLESLKQESIKTGAMAIDTIRYPESVCAEIEAFCREHKVKKAVVLRRCLTAGWDALKEQL